ncbi:dihydrodipicolinate synthase family protein [Geomicrobium sp. JCM 19038]|uniref:dihydrodipicolinate synthase family protein n=1 Tax=Geomicrobium sp. JCM 19038 TaxID=1460635 RepID=UPI00045F39B9|nr:dihydrodipicolinate synthase family protein [Geomicrobium sp. JCM 19038]GAK07982.1 dihydrodipicolinate synthase [Geomicrobium sp. JCM 19038]
MKIAKALETISGIPITPFRATDGQIDWVQYKETIDLIVENGIDVIVPCGNTSEFYALSIAEAKEEIRRTIEIVNGRALVMAGIGYAVPTAIELGNYAKDVGADAVMIHMPIHPYVTTGGVKAYFQEIIEAIDIPTVIYFKDPEVSDQVLIDLAPLDNFVGVKYAINDLPRFAKIVRTISKEHGVTWICGTAEKWAPFYWNAGAKGFTSGLVNILPGKAVEMLDALRNDDHAIVWKLWEEILPFEDLRAQYNQGNNVVVIKEAMEMLGQNAGVTRAPVDALSDADKALVRELLHSWNLLETAKG